MFRSLLLVLAALLMPAAAIAQTSNSAPQPPNPDLWAISDTQIASIPARIAFPRELAGLTAVRVQEFSHEGEGIDGGVHYRSADGEIWATVYIYYPGLPHAGIAAFATDHAIRSNPESVIEGGAVRIDRVGETEGAAIRATYSGFLGNRVSSAAFIKAGRWIVKLRVSGAMGRAADVEAAMDALLRDLRIGPANRVHPAAALTIDDCPSGTGSRRARELPDPPSEEMAAQGFLATFDGGGIEGRDENGTSTILPSRLPDRFCRMTLSVGRDRLPLLRAEPGEARSIDGRTMLIVPIGDSGRVLEVVHAENLGGYLLLWHDIGATTLLGRFDAVPSNAQIAAILQNGASGAGRPRVPVRLRPDAGPAMSVPAPSRQPET